MDTGEQIERFGEVSIWDSLWESSAWLPEAESWILPDFPKFSSWFDRDAKETH